MKHTLSIPRFSLWSTSVVLPLVAGALLLECQAQTPGADSFNPGAEGWVNALAQLPNSNIVVAGYFSRLGGQSRQSLGRVRADGSVDGAFSLGADQEITTLAVQPDGGMLVGGSFGILGGLTRNFLGRISANSSVDSGFNPGANAAVLAFAQQTNGLTVVGGAFSYLGGQTRQCLARLKSDGTLDPSFTAGANAAVFTLAMQPDGKILVGGWFSVLAGQPRYQIGRLNADGSLDAGFSPSASGAVYALAVQPDGKILVGGSFTTMSGASSSYLARLKADGAIDPTFVPQAGGPVNSVALQTDGKILVAGAFNAMGLQQRNYIARLKADGSLDNSFDPNAAGEVYALAAQTDGKLLVGGYFTGIGGQSRQNLARLNRTDATTNSLWFEGSSITWSRRGCGPEVWRAWFEVSTNGTAWVNLGNGRRIANGWELTNINLQAGASVRARGAATGGRNNATSWFVEQTGTPPGITSQPTNTIANGGACASFSVAGLGNAPLSFQWRKDGTNLTDSANVSGASSTNLILCNLQPGDAGSYSVVVSNATGLVMSQDAVLQVRPCWIWNSSFGWLWDTGTGWYGGSAYGWMWFDTTGGWIWSTSLQGWLGIADPNSPTLWSVQYRWLTPSATTSSLANTSALGLIHVGSYGGATITDGWVVSDRFGYIWPTGDGVWFYSDVYGWLGVTADGGIWCVNQGKFL